MRTIKRLIRRIKQWDCRRKGMGVWLVGPDLKCHNTCMLICEDCKHRDTDEIENIIGERGDWE